MLTSLIWSTGLLCVITVVFTWTKHKDVFHPLILITPMFGFVYVYMPLRLLDDGEIFSYVNESQAVFYQVLILLGLTGFVLGCLKGSAYGPKRTWSNGSATYDRNKIQLGGYFLGSLGLACWVYCFRNVGGIANAFSEANARGWSDFGFIREAAYLMIVAQLLLLSPEGLDLKNNTWRLAVVLFAVPYLLQGLLGAQRGPTFLIIATLTISWFLGRRSRPPLVVVLGGGGALLFLMLFLVTNRGKIHLGSDFDVKTDVSDFFSASTANEYIFGIGATTTTNQTGKFYWGRRYLAQVLVRPIPRQLWPTKYQDFGIPEIEQNAGAGVEGMDSVMGWQAMTGAAATMIADVWIEFSWLYLPFLVAVGWLGGYLWRRAIWQGEQWTTIFTVVLLLSAYFVSQSGEAVIFRLLILTVPSTWVWRWARSEVTIMAPQFAYRG
jgi:oligosaccharide repeat unit polymerase